MDTNPNSKKRPNKVTGILWIVAALLMGVPPLFTDGNKSLIAIGAMFLIIGLASLRNTQKT